MNTTLRKILVVADDSTMRRVLAKILRDFEVLHADGIHAAERLVGETSELEAIVWEVNSPADSLEQARRMQLARMVPILWVGSSPPLVENRAVVMKPFGAKQLREELHHLMACEK